MSDGNQHTVVDGRSNVPAVRMGEQGQRVVDDGHCRECGKDLGAGYLCDDCDTVDVHE